MIEIGSRTTSVVLVDDHPVVALGLRLAFQERGSFSLIGTATDPTTAPELIERLKPDVVIVDLVFAGAVQLGVIEMCRRACPACTLVVFSSLPARLYEAETLRAGADSYVSKDHDLGGLVDVLSEVASKPGAVREQGAAPATGAGEARLVIGDVHLTPREVEVGRLLSRGLSVARIAEEVGISANTIAAHRDNIRKKLGCRDTAELIARLARVYETPRPE